MLIIKNPKDILGMNFVDGKYKLYAVEEYGDRYTFEFKTTKSIWAIIHIFREPKWDAAEDRNMYRVDNGKFDKHWISADYFSKIKNVQWTFNQALKDL